MPDLKITGKSCNVDKKYHFQNNPKFYQDVFFLSLYFYNHVNFIRKHFMVNKPISKA